MKIFTAAKLDKVLTKHARFSSCPQLNGKKITYLKQLSKPEYLLTLLWFTLTCNIKGLRQVTHQNKKKLITLDCKKLDAAILEKIYDKIFLNSDFKRLSQKWSQKKDACLKLKRGSDEVQSKLGKIQLAFNQRLDQGDVRAIKFLLEINQSYYDELDFERLGVLPLVKKGAALKDPKSMYEYATIVSSDQALSINERAEKEVIIFEQLVKLFESKKADYELGNYERYKVYRRLEEIYHVGFADFNEKKEVFMNKLYKNPAKAKACLEKSDLYLNLCLTEWKLAIQDPNCNPKRLNKIRKNMGGYEFVGNSQIIQLLLELYTNHYPDKRKKIAFYQNELANRA